MKNNYQNILDVTLVDPRNQRLKRLGQRITVRQSAHGYLVWHEVRGLVRQDGRDWDKRFWTFKSARRYAERIIGDLILQGFVPKEDDE